MHDLIYEELISKSCNPSRIFNWNEDFCDMFRIEFLEECKKIFKNYL
jgi:hypothetical protein